MLQDHITDNRRRSRVLLRVDSDAGSVGGDVRRGEVVVARVVAVLGAAVVLKAGVLGLRLDKRGFALALFQPRVGGLRVEGESLDGHMSVHIRRGDQNEES